MDPINYSALQVNPLASFNTGLQTGVNLENLAIQRQQAQQAQALQQQKQQAALLFQRAILNPNSTAADYNAALSLDPGLREPIKDAFDRMTAQQQTAQKSNIAKFGSALSSGNIDVANAMIDEQVNAMRNSNADPAQIKQFEAIKQIAQESPDIALGMVKALAMALPDGDKIVNSFGAIQKQNQERLQFPIQTDKLAAEALKTGGEAMTTVAQGIRARDIVAANLANVESQIAERGAKTALDRDKYNLDFEKTLLELKSKGTAPALSAGMEKLQAEAVDGSLQAKDAATRALSAADVFKQYRGTISGKPVEFVTQKLKEQLGMEDAYSEIRRQYIRLKNRGALQDLPPGPATDRDMAAVMAGFPSDNSSPETLENWLRSFANVQQAVAKKEEAKAEWISNVGSLRVSPTDINIMGVQVPAGTSFVDFVTKSKVTQSAPPAGNVQSLIQQFQNYQGKK